MRPQEPRSPDPAAIPPIVAHIFRPAPQSIEQRPVPKTGILAELAKYRSH